MDSNQQQVLKETVTSLECIKGMDISTLLEIEHCGGKYYDQGIERDLILLMKDYGFNYVRLRLWNDPYSEDGKPYGAGTNDLRATIELAKRAKNAGLKVLLDYHYSDFWADPGKQYLPKAWKDMNEEQIQKALYDFTKETLLKMEFENCFPDMIQVGNELSNGLLWPYGKVPNYEAIANFINAGIRAVRSVSKKVPIMLHLDNGGNQLLYQTWFDEYMKRGEDFQIIGLSYYPFWHGTMEAFRDNMNQLATRYHKDLVVAEVSFGFTMEDYGTYEQLNPCERKGMATKPELVQTIPYDMSKMGQCKFLQDFLGVIEQVPEKKGRGFFYWEPGWIPVKGSEWSTKEAREYIKEPGNGGNEWANQALFDYEGNALPSLEVIRDFKPSL